MFSRLIQGYWADLELGVGWLTKVVLMEMHYDDMNPSRDTIESIASMVSFGFSHKQASKMIPKMELIIIILTLPLLSMYCYQCMSTEQVPASGFL
jgi:hypothetical protein